MSSIRALRSAIRPLMAQRMITAEEYGRFVDLVLLVEPSEQRYSLVWRYLTLVTKKYNRTSFYTTAFTSDRARLEAFARHDAVSSRMTANPPVQSSQGRLGSCRPGRFTHHIGDLFGLARHKRGKSSPCVELSGEGASL